MDKFKRYGIYVVPDGAFYAAASAWLGWDSVKGQAVAHPVVPNLPEPVEDLTATPRKYGFHGTIKPPFVLAEGTDEDSLHAVLGRFCASQSPVEIATLDLRRLGGFVAVVPATPSVGLADLAANTVGALDMFRAPPSEAELARRRRGGLTSRQEALLQAWGYPYVMEEFRFHLTLTGRTTQGDAVRAALADHFAPVLPSPFVIDSLSLMGEDDAGRFHRVHRYPLTG